MVLQVFFYSASSNERINFTKNFHRAKHLYESNYAFKQDPVHLHAFFNQHIDLDAYITLDEGIVMTYFQLWSTEEDAVLRDLSRRFLNRKLFQYVEITPATQYKKLQQLEDLFAKAGIDPEYYLVVDSSSD